MLPIAGSFVKGLAAVAVVFLDNLERLAKNKEDIQVLARDITDVVIIVRDAGIKISAEPRSIEDVADLRNACSEFQNNHGLWKDIKRLLTSRDIKETINGHRQVMEGARSNLLLSLTLKSNVSLSHITHGVTALQSSQTDLMAVTCDIKRDVSHIGAHGRDTLPNGKFHHMMYGDIQCRENWSKKSLIGQIEQGPIHMGEILKYVADVSTSNRVMVVKEYSGSAGLLQWKTDFDLHSKAPRHPNFRQLYGVVKSQDWPCLVFHGADDEIPYCQYPKLFDKRIQPLAKSALYHNRCSLLKFLISCWGVTLNESTARCSPDGRLIFDDLEELSWATTWDKIYVNDFENILGPVPPAVQWSLNLLMLRRQEPSVQKEYLVTYFRVMSVGTPWSMIPDVDIDIPNSTLIGTIVISDPLEHRHFAVDCLGDEIPPVKLSIQSYAMGELLELPNGLWRFIRPQSAINESESFLHSIFPESLDFLGLGFTCSMELTSDARSQHLCSWFSQGPRILAKISETLNADRHPELVVSQFSKRRFQIRVLRSDSEVDSDSPPPDIPYIFIDLPFMRQNGKSHSITLPDIYLSMDPQGARPGPDCTWKNFYKLEIVDMGDSGLFVSRVNLKMGCFLQERCGFRTTSIDAAIFLNQRELTFQMINDEAIRNALSNGVDISVCDDQEDFPVRWEELKEYSALLKCYDGIELLPEDRDTPGNEIAQIPEDELNMKSYSGAHNAD